MLHVPSPSDYLPYDSNTPSFISQDMINVYFRLAVATLVLYDHMITLDLEVERIWTLKWAFPKCLFMASRYVVIPLLLVTLMDDVGYPLLFSYCIFDDRFHKPLSVVSLIIAELVLLLRVSALYGHSKIMLSFLVGLFTCQFAAVVLETVMFMKFSTPLIAYEFLPGCWGSFKNTPSALRWRYSWWIPFMCFDGILLTLALVKAFAFRGIFNPTIRLLARDSVLYFVLMFACLVVNLVAGLPGLNIPVVIPAEWIACIAVSRMMMNIRSLVFDNSGGSQRVELSTLVFQDGNPARDRRFSGVDTAGCV